MVPFELPPVAADPAIVNPSIPLITKPDGRHALPSFIPINNEVLIDPELSDRVYAYSALIDISITYLIDRPKPTYGYSPITNTFTQAPPNEKDEQKNEIIDFYSKLPEKIKKYFILFIPDNLETEELTCYAGLLINPEGIQEIIDYLGDPEQDSFAKRIIVAIKYSGEYKNEPFTASDKKLVLRAKKMRSILWHAMAQRLESEEDKDEIYHRSLVHELTHSQTFANLWGGAYSGALDLFQKYSEDIYDYLDKEEAGVALFHQLWVLIGGLDEARAILHDVLGDFYITTGDRYSHSEMLYRLSEIIPVFFATHGGDLSIHNILELPLSTDVHILGMIIILMFDMISTNSEDDAHEAKHLLAYKVPRNKLISRLLDRIEYFTKKPEAAKRHLLASYDRIQELLRRSSLQFISDVVKYVTFLENDPNKAQ